MEGEYNLFVVAHHLIDRKENDTFTLLDAGGITMVFTLESAEPYGMLRLVVQDIVTYTIIGFNPLRLNEIVRSDGNDE